MNKNKEWKMSSIVIFFMGKLLFSVLIVKLSQLICFSISEKRTNYLDVVERCVQIIQKKKQKILLKLNICVKEKHVYV